MTPVSLLLDRAPKGRNETGVWWKRHDEYETEPRGKDQGAEVYAKA
jgi:predicted dithiol-disulfide oxidoreductase (DUF899 family)